MMKRGMKRGKRNGSKREENRVENAERRMKEEGNIESNPSIREKLDINEKESDIVKKKS